MSNSYGDRPQGGRPEGEPFYPPPAYPPPINPVRGGSPVALTQRKSVGLAVFLTFLLLGAGHMYAGQQKLGVALAIFACVLIVILFTRIGAVVSVMLWLITAPIAMIWSASAVRQYNAAL